MQVLGVPGKLPKIETHPSSVTLGEKARNMAEVDALRTCTICFCFCPVSLNYGEPLEGGELWGHLTS